MKKTAVNYSALLSIYKKERPEYLQVALDSLLGQTVPPAEIVMVKDGELTDGLNSVLDNYDSCYPGLFKFVSYEENHGLGYALNRGVSACSHEIIARMDTDDFSFPNRMEIQLSLMSEGDYDMLSSQVVEFIDDLESPISVSDLPETDEGIRAYSKRRNPFRHPAMTFRKSKVLQAGNYSAEYLFFEDWDLFNRMLACGSRATNVHEPLVAMRVSEDFYARRGGPDYLRHALKFKLSQLQTGYFSIWDFLASFVPQAAVCLMPNNMRSFVYKRVLRRDGAKN